MNDKATALYFDGKNAPSVTAKGSDALARQIVEEAREKKIPILEHPFLARALDPLEVSEPIPEDMYLIIAEILSLVYRLEDKAPP